MPLHTSTQGAVMDSANDEPCQPSEQQEHKTKQDLENCEMKGGGVETDRENNYFLYKKYMEVPNIF